MTFHIFEKSFFFCFLKTAKIRQEESEYLKIAPRTDANARLLFPKSVKGHNFVKKCHRVMALSQIIALVMVNKCVKFQTNSFNNKEVMTKVKVFHAYANDAADDNDNDNDNTNDDDARVIAIPRLFFFEKQTS